MSIASDFEWPKSIDAAVSAERRRVKQLIALAKTNQGVYLEILARVCRVSDSTLRRWKDGLRRPDAVRLAVLEQLASGELRIVRTWRGIELVEGDLFDDE